MDQISPPAAIEHAPSDFWIKQRAGSCRFLIVVGPCTERVSTSWSSIMRFIFWIVYVPIFGMILPISASREERKSWNNNPAMRNTMINVHVALRKLNICRVPNYLPWAKTRAHGKGPFSRVPQMKLTANNRHTANDSFAVCSRTRHTANNNNTAKIFKP